MDSRSGLWVKLVPKQRRWDGFEKIGGEALNGVLGRYEVERMVGGSKGNRRDGWLVRWWCLQVAMERWRG